MAELIIRSGVHVGKRLALPARPIVIGRDETCQIRLNSSLVSRRHCQIHATPEGIVVEDLQSQNGTFVNDVPVKDRLTLKSGDLLRIGANVFQAAEPGPAAAGSEVRPGIAPPARATNSSSSAALPNQAIPPKATAQRHTSGIKKVSDADIASWLTEEEEGDSHTPNPLAGETTILKRPAAALNPMADADTAELAPIPAQPHAPASPIVAMAAEIIRERWRRRRDGHN